MLRGKASYGQAGSEKTYTMGSAAAHAMESLWRVYAMEAAEADHD